MKQFERGIAIRNESEIGRGGKMSGIQGSSLFKGFPFLRNSYSRKQGKGRLKSRWRKTPSSTSVAFW